MESARRRADTEAFFPELTSLCERASLCLLCPPGELDVLMMPSAEELLERQEEAQEEDGEAQEPQVQEPQVQEQQEDVEMAEAPLTADDVDIYGA